MTISGTAEERLPVVPLEQSLHVGDLTPPMGMPLPGGYCATGSRTVKLLPSSATLSTLT